MFERLGPDAVCRQRTGIVQPDRAAEYARHQQDTLPALARLPTVHSQIVQ